MSDQNKGLYNKYQIINRETGQEAAGNYFVLKPAKDPAARAALLAYAEATDNYQLAADITVWVSSLPDFLECDWCGETATELSYPHMFDPAIGKRMCRNCWNHDREVYKGAYGEDIGEFKPIQSDKESDKHEMA
ncbi:hypothetical protein NYE69_28100 [Paenibacillus sp. FSL R5-0527]|uniref:hypothetical protein n=1 Tax=Paenibacillus sp. FSL R5-0527 TaxID=2975321 RepID=UPI00097B5CCF|nr:hypothetical protein BK140_11285 [Paenibacillus macerans]